MIISPYEQILDFLDDYNYSINDLFDNLDLDKEIINALIVGLIVIDEEIAQELSKFFNNSKEFWLNLQQEYDRRTYEENKH